MSSKKRKRKTLATEPKLVAQLDYEVGSPEHDAALKLTLGSGKKLNWKDEKGHQMVCYSFTVEQNQMVEQVVPIVLMSHEQNRIRGKTYRLLVCTFMIFQKLLLV